jgi:hypothetical protein
MVGIGYSTGRPRIMSTCALVGSAGNGSLGGTDRQLCDEGVVHTERRMNIEGSKRCKWMAGLSRSVGRESGAMDRLGLSAAAAGHRPAKTDGATRRRGSTGARRC